MRGGRGGRSWDGEIKSAMYLFRMGDLGGATRSCLLLLVWIRNLDFVVKS